MSKKKNDPCKFRGREDECSNTDALACKVSGDMCPNKRNALDEKRKDHTPLINCVLILVAIVLLLGSVILQLTDCNCRFLTLCSDFCFGIAISAIASLIISRAIDLPAKLREYETSFLNALSSNRYINTLHKDQLKRLRTDVTNALYSKTSPNMAKGLIDLDADICDLLDNVYCVRYRQTVICSEDTTNKGMVIKKNRVEYELVNPHQGEINEKIYFTNLYRKLDDKDDISKYFPRFEVKLFKKENLQGEYEPMPELNNYGLIDGPKPDSESEFYNARVDFADKESKNIGYSVHFKYMLKVVISFTIVVPEDDICFTKRVKVPTCNFRVDYSYDSKNVKLYGQLFGTNIDQSEVSVNNMGDNKISLETSQWLLPKDGAIVVVTRK